MFLDLPLITATNSLTEPDRLERLMRVYGYAVALADADGAPDFVEKFGQLHDHKGTLIVFWHQSPTDQDKGFFARAWQSRMGDGTANVEHEA